MDKQIELIILMVATFALSTKGVDKYKNTNQTTPSYRLSGDVIPEHYALRIKLGKNAFETNTFQGEVYMRIVVKKPTKDIQLHYQNITISKLELVQNQRALTTVYNNYSDVTQILTISVPETLKQNRRYDLKIKYKGIMSETSMDGFYKSSYIDKNGVVNYLATTQFEPTSARKAFPCFDEPALKAQFDMIITCPSDYNVLANTDILDVTDIDGEFTEVTFHTTPRMSTYLVAFTISKFECIEGEPVDGVPNSVCSRPGTQKLASLAATTSSKALRIMKEYTNYSYSKTNVSKMTHIAIPDFSEGAMENWGLITYRELYLLYSNEDDPVASQQNVATTIVHELSHQWFGDLVTLNWWTDIFLNEGFATYFEYYATNEIYPSWDLIKQFVLQLQIALDIDSNNMSKPLSYYVEQPSEIAERFDGISYNKGGSIISMVHHFLGINNFKKGLAKYISENQFSTTNPETLWSAFEEFAKTLPKPQSLPSTMVNVMKNWTYCRGYPLLTVTVNGTNVVISQEEFIVSGSGNNTQWYVPITYTMSNMTADSKNTTTKVWLKPSEKLILNDVFLHADWIILNNQQVGFYRVNYDKVLLANIFEAFSESEFGKVDEISRSQIVDDLLSLARSSKKTYSEVLSLLNYLSNETSYYVWEPAISKFNYILTRIGSKSDVRSAFLNWTRSASAKLYGSTSFNQLKPQDHLYSLKQAMALSWSCVIETEDCINTSKQIFARYRDNAIKPYKNLKTVVYCNALRYSENPQRDYIFLFNEFAKTQNSAEQVTILKGIGCSRDHDVIELFLKEMLQNNSVIRIQDTVYALASLINSNIENVDFMFDSVLAQLDQFNSRFGNLDTAVSLIGQIADRFSTQEQFDKLKKLSDDTSVPMEIQSAAKDSLPKVSINLKMTSTIATQLRDFFHISDKSSAEHVHKHALSITLLACGIIIHTYYYYI